MIDSLVAQCLNFQQNWPVTALIIVLTALILRYLLVRDSFRAVKGLGRETYREVIRRYSPLSLSGWLLILSAAVTAGLLVVLPRLIPFWMTRGEGMMISALMFLAGVLLHLRAVHLATVAALRENSELDRTF